MPCSDAVADAVEAFRELSSLAWLDAQRGTGPPLKESVDAAWNRFRDATVCLDTLPRDEAIAELIDEIGGITSRVDREINDQATESMFAEAMARGLTGDASDAFFNVSGLVYVATQWDLDPAGAVAFLASPAGGKRAHEQ